MVGLADTSLRSLANLVSPAQISAGALASTLHTLDAAGFRSVDAWGGMTFEHALRVLDENPWERLRALASHLSVTPLRLTVRGRCLLGARPYSWPVVDAFVKQAVECGVKTFLIYEPLNDLEALARLAAIVRETGAGLSLALIHGGNGDLDPESTGALGARLAALEPDELCLKLAGSLGPRATHGLVSALRDATTLPLEVDLDNGNGLGVMAAAAALEGGADVVDCSTAPTWLDPSGIPLQSFLSVLEGVSAPVEADSRSCVAAGASFAALAAGSYIRWPAYAEVAAAHAQVDFATLEQIPGYLARQVGERLLTHGGASRLPDVLSEMAVIRGEIGQPALVAPIGHVVATQAVLNVVYGGRWSVVPDEMKALLRGAYGMLPSAANPDVVSAALPGGLEGDEAPTQEDTSLAELLEEAAGLAESTADVLLYALAPEAALAFLTKRRTALSIDLSPLTPTAGLPTEEWEDEWRGLGPERVKELVTLLESSAVDEISVENRGTRVSVSKSSRGGEEAAFSPPTAAPSPDAFTSGDTAAAQADLATPVPASLDMPGAAPGSVIGASMVGTFYRSAAPGTEPYVDVGRHVDKGDVLCVLEAMKLMNDMVAEAAGTITAILAEDGMPVEYGQPLFIIDLDG